MQPWLIKSEPDVFGIDHLKKVGREPWSGVRNYQARNFMMNGMKPRDLALFYHSNAQPPGVAGLARVVGKPYPDPTQFDPKNDYFDAKSKPGKPRWWLTDFEFVAKFEKFLTLETIKADPLLAEMVICQKGTRLSITPVDLVHFKRICKLVGWKR